MSKLLEQAIVDAAALKEAAIKNAEEAIIKKFTPDIKDAISNLLNEEEALGMPSAPAPEGISDIPLAATDGENACPCPEEGEEVAITLDLERLAQAISDESPTDSDLESTEMSLAPEAGTEEEEELEEPLAEEEQIDLSEEDLANILSNLLKEAEPKPDYLDLDGDGNEEEPMTKAAKEKKASVKETVDPMTAASDEEERKDDEKEQDDEYLAQKHSSVGLGEDQKPDITKEFKQVQETIEKLTSENIRLKNLMEKNETERKEQVSRLSETIQEVNLYNAKLLYTNKTLTAAAMNARQKQKVVEAINKTSSVEEAKIIFETLQNTVGSKSTKTGPESLSEVVSRERTKVLKPVNENKNPEVNNRWKMLAGIK